MRRSVVLLLAAVTVRAQQALPQATPGGASIPAGVPLRIVLERRVPVRRAETPVRGLLLTPVYLYDRKVLPAGSVVEGRIAAIGPVPLRVRLRAALSGNFTPPRKALTRFDTIVLDDGQRLPIRAAASSGAAFVNVAAKRKWQAGPKPGQREPETCPAPVCALKPPGKMARLEEALFERLPYRRQAWKAGTLFTSVLQEPLVAPVPAAAGPQMALWPAADLDGQSVTARLLTALDSATAHRGMPIEAVVTRPQFSADHRLLIPEGTLLRGEVVDAKHARWLHRNGKLLFAFRQVDLAHAPAQPIQGYLEAAQVGVSGNLAIDSEGDAHVSSPASRFLFPAIAAAVAGLSFHQDYNSQGIPDQDAGGRAESGAVGLGLIGTVVAQVSRPLASSIAIMGAGLSIYSTFIARGQNVALPVNTFIEVGLKRASEPIGTRPAAAGPPMR